MLDLLDVAFSNCVFRPLTSKLNVRKIETEDLWRRVASNLPMRVGNRLGIRFLSFTKVEGSVSASFTFIVLQGYSSNAITGYQLTEQMESSK